MPSRDYYFNDGNYKKVSIYTNTHLLHNLMRSVPILANSFGFICLGFELHTLFETVFCVYLCCGDRIYSLCDYTI